MNVYDILTPKIKRFPSMQMMLNPNLDSDKSEIEVGRLIPFSGDSVELSSEKGYQTFCILILKQRVILKNKFTIYLPTISL